MIDKFFKLSENNSNFRTELIAGLTTFLTMCYIIFVQPAVLSQDLEGNPTGLDFGAVLLATCLASSISTFLMGIYARYPIALAPGMGINFFFISVIMSLQAMGVAHAWQVALGIVFISGLLFFLLSIFNIREIIVNAISMSLKNGIATGIGLFIAFIGLRHGNIIIQKTGTWVGLNHPFWTVDTGIFFIGFITICVLQIRRFPGAILWGMLVSAFFAFFLGKIEFNGFIGLPVIAEQAAFKMDLMGALTLTSIPFIIVFLFMDLFDTTGTLIGIAEQAGFMKDNKLPGAKRVMIVDSIGTMIGAMLGTSTVTSFIESASGVEQGGRTGLTSVVTSICLFLSIFFFPIIGMIAAYPPITAPALVIVGGLMIKNVIKIDWNNFSEGIPAFMIMIGIPLTYSIADGLALGFISYPLIKLLSGRRKEIHILNYGLAVILILYFIFIRSKI